MNEQKRRNFLIAIAAVVAIGGGLLAVWPPAFQSEDASGAIGAVQKHRQSQISNKDVILSDQNTVNDAKILFGDQLEDALKLQKMGTEFAAMAVYNRDSLGAVGAMLDSHQADLQSRFGSNMSDTLNAADSQLNASSGLFAASALDNMKAELSAIEKSLGASQSLNAAQMDSLNSRLGSVVADMQSRLSAQASIGAMADTLNAASALGKQASIGSADVLGVASQLNAAAESLNANVVLGASLADRAGNLGAMVLQAQALENVEASLGAAMANKGDLQSHLGKMTDALGAAAAGLESMALENMNSRLQAQQQLGVKLESMKAGLGSMQLENKSLDAKTIGSFNDAVGMANKTLGNLDTALASRMYSNMQVELSAVGSHLNAVSALQAAMVENRLGARDELGAKLAAKDELGAKVGSQDALGAKLEAKGALGAKLAAKDALGAKFAAKNELGAKLFSNASLDGFTSYLGAVSSALESNSLGAKAFANRQELGAQASELQNKAAGLQAKADQN